MTEQQLEIPLIYEEVRDRTRNGFPDDIAKYNSEEHSLLDLDEKLDENGMKSPRKAPTKGISKRRIGLAIVGLLLLGALGFFTFRALSPSKDDSSKKGDKQDRVIPVAVATVAQKTVPIQLQAIGNVQASSTVSVTPQAGGQITGVHFKKGQDVRKGDLLFTLDNRSQLASLQQAQGVLARDRAQVEQARANLTRDLGLVRSAEATLAKDEAQAQFAQAQSDRYNALYKQGAISQDQAQQYATTNRVSEAVLQSDREAISNALAVVEGDKAAIENALAVVATDEGSYQSVQVQASYTEIYAPIDGRVGNILVTEGNVVQANSSSPLVTIAQVSPIQVSFAIPESNLPEIQKRMKNGKLTVDVTFAGNTTPISGVLTFLNNTVDNTTGTIQLIGDFNNTDGKLFPGQFVNTTLTLTQAPNAIVVPAQAVQNGANGQFVFVVNTDADGNSTVTNVPVVATSTVDGLNIIQQGLKPGDRVVMDGQANLVTGSKVSVKATDPNSGNPNSGSKSGSSSGSKSGANDNAKPSTDPSQAGKKRKSHSTDPSTNPATNPAGKPSGGN